MASEPIILIDLPSKPPCKCWSLNPWKTRFALNFKGLDYKTDWTEYPDLKPKLKEHLPPHQHGHEYTSPSIRLPDGTWVSDSRVIATALEARYPSPSLHLDSPALARLEELMPDATQPIRPVFVPLVPRALLNEASHAHWYATRERAVGMPLDQLEGERGGPPAWEAAAPAFAQVTALLRETHGPYFMGATPSYADFVWGGFLIFCRRCGLLEEMLRASGDREAHLALLEAVGPWAERDDH